MGWMACMDLRPGITAVIGGGGKTTFLRKAGEELTANGQSVLLTTTTKMFPFPDLPCAESLDDLDALRKAHPFICAGVPIPGTQKLGAVPIPIQELTARFSYVLVEADGSAQRPMKAHAPHEPVIPGEAGQSIYLIGASGFGRTIAEAAHRPELYARLAGVSPDDRITPQIAASVFCAEGWKSTVLINQVETEEQQEAAMHFAALVDVPVYMGSLQRGEIRKCEL